MPRRAPSPSPEILALKALAFLAAGEARLMRLMGETGADADSLRGASDEVLAAAMDFLLGHEDLAAAFCTEEDISAEALHRARARLPGA